MVAGSSWSAVVVMPYTHAVSDASQKTYVSKDPITLYSSVAGLSAFGPGIRAAIRRIGLNAV